MLKNLFVFIKHNLLGTVNKEKLMIIILQVGVGELASTVYRIYSFSGNSYEPFLHKLGMDLVFMQGRKTLQ